MTERTINLLYADKLEVMVFMLHTIANQTEEGRTDYKTDPLFIKYKDFVTIYEEFLAKANERTLKSSAGN